MVFLPVYDYNRLRHIKRPWMNWSLIAINIFIYFVFQSDLILKVGAQVQHTFGFMPNSILPASMRQMNVPALIAEVPGIKVFTYMFLHGDAGHLLGNMLFLYIFGDNVEDAMGRIRYLVFYLGCGIFSGLAHFWSDTSSQAALVGASGAISGVLAAYLILYPRAKLWALLLFRIPLKVLAFVVLLLYIAYNVFAEIATQFRILPDYFNERIAWWAHIGGFIAGIPLTYLLRRPGVELFAKDDTVTDVATGAQAVPINPMDPPSPGDSSTVIVRVDRPREQP